MNRFMSETLDPTVSHRFFSFISHIILWWNNFRNDICFYETVYCLNNDTQWEYSSWDNDDIKFRKYTSSVIVLTLSHPPFVPLNSFPDHLLKSNRPVSQWRRRRRRRCDRKVNDVIIIIVWVEKKKTTLSSTRERSRASQWPNYTTSDDINNNNKTTTTTSKTVL